MTDSIAIAQALKEVTESMVANDKSILDLCKVMADKIQTMEQSIIGLELRIDYLNTTVKLLDADVHAYPSSEDAKTD